MGVNYNPGIVPSNLNVYLDAGNTKSYPGTGTAWNNLVGTNNYTMAGTTWNSAGYFTFNGTSGEAYSTGAVTFPSINTTSFSVCGWFRTSTSSGKKLFGFENVNTGTGSNSYDKHLYVNTSGKLVWAIWSGTANTVATSASYTDNNWYNFAVVYSYSAGGSTNTIYVNGVSVATMTATSIPADVIYFRIGAYANVWPGGGSGYFPGDISNIMFYYGTALSAGQVAQNFNSLRGRYGV